MGENPTRITEELIGQIDNLTLNPKVRAKIVWDKLKDSEMHSWTVVCFCVEYLKRVAVDLEYLKPEVTRLSQLVYNQHYLFPDALGIIIDPEIRELTKKDELQPEQEKSDTGSGSVGSTT